jgi:succinyl-CoA synthetase beta subunit
LQGIYDLFIDIDATLLEINPLGLMADGAICVADAKVTIDDSAMYRQPNIAAMRDVAEENPGEVAASDVGLNYISLDGNIGCLVNGAGLAMATMDIIKLYGGSPANFLDIGGGATVSQVSAAFSIMLGQDAVEVILVNIFGGIMQCDVIAAGIVEAVQNVGLKLPLIIRLEGTNVEEGREILVASGIQFTSANTMDDAARLATAAIQG